MRDLFVHVIFEIALFLLAYFLLFLSSIQTRQYTDILQSQTQAHLQRHTLYSTTRAYNYQRAVIGIHKMEESQPTQCPQEKEQKHKQRYTKHCTNNDLQNTTQKPKYRTMKIEGLNMRLCFLSYCSCIFLYFYVCIVGCSQYYLTSIVLFFCIDILKCEGKQTIVYVFIL